MNSELLAQIGINPSWLAPLHETFNRYSINTPNRIAGFIGQTAHESNNYRTLQENLNYSANGLVTVWPSRFPSFDIANEYARQPERIANKVYSNRMGNGDEASGEGHKYKGRGALQLTGKSNYKDFSEYLKKPEILDNPDLVATEYAFESAKYFFDKNKLWDICNEGINDSAIGKLTKRINGGTHGLADRKAKTELYYGWLK